MRNKGRKNKMKPKIRQDQVLLPEAEFQFGSGLPNGKLQEGNKICYIFHSVLREKKEPQTVTSIHRV